MATLMGIFIGFVLLVLLVGFSHKATTGYAEKIQRLKAEKQQLQTRIQDLKRNTTNLKEMELSLSRQLDGEERGSGSAAGMTGRLGGARSTSVSAGGIRAKTAKRREQAKSVVDVLLAERLLTPEDLAKAEAYKAQSQSPYPLDEIIAMLGYVSSEAILRVKSRYPDLS